MKVTLVLSLLAVLAFTAQAYVVENYSFELPGDGKIKGWDAADGAYYVDTGASAEVPGWESDGTTIDSGVETGWGATDGIWSAFMMGGDPSLYQLTDVVITAGESYLLLADAWVTWGSNTVKMSMYYDDAGTRVEVASALIDISGGAVTGQLTYIADNGPAEAIGMNLGIEFSNASANWAGMDNVRLVPEPATLVLMGLGGLSLLRRRK